MFSQYAGFLRRVAPHLEQRGKTATYSYISRVEGGDRRPSVHVMRALAAELGVTGHYLEFGHEYRCPHCGTVVAFDPLTGDA